MGRASSHVVFQLLTRLNRPLIEANAGLVPRVIKGIDLLFCQALGGSHADLEEGPVVGGQVAQVCIVNPRVLHDGEGFQAV